MPPRIPTAACPYCPVLDSEDLPSEVGHLHWLHERIRDLEAELELRKNAADGVQELLIEAAKDKLHAEHAEARVVKGP